MIIDELRTKIVLCSRVEQSLLFDITLELLNLIDRQQTEINALSVAVENLIANNRTSSEDKPLTNRSGPDRRFRLPENNYFHERRGQE